MAYLKNEYTVYLDGRCVGYYYSFSDGTYRFYTANGSPWDIGERLTALGLAEEKEERIESLEKVIKKKYLLPGSRRPVYEKDGLRLERVPRETNEFFSIYRRAADEGDSDYSPLRHDAPHWEGEHTPEGMREWANYYLIRKMDDGTYQAELDEAWWWGGSHNDGGTIHTEVPEEWFSMPYDEFLEKLVTIAAAAHYGFTADMLKDRKGLREFLGYGEDGKTD
ncbi:MAG: hypothetical protein J5744_01260 [Oscillospiraceae bacterium]|nr:hypothetical protein [Oscillospiraceae bacterium]